MKLGHSLALLAIAAVPATAATPAAPDFGPNVLVFSRSMAPETIQAQIDKVYATQHHNEFGPERNAILFLPGDYSVDVPIGFYTQVLGLGASPDAVHITGNVHSDAAARNNNATTTFWRAAENFSVAPTGGTMQWAVSQAAPFRRMHVQGDIVLNQNKGWASGGWMSDTLIDGNVASGTQQQWISRNSEWHSWTGANWNMVFVGVPNPPEGEWPSPPYTKVARTPTVREKPFLEVDASGNYSVRVPAVRSDSSGITWHAAASGKSIPIAQFYIAHPNRDNAATINEQLAKGKNLLLTPGIYDLTEAIHITRPNTVVMGLGFATLHPVNGNAAMTTADADGIVIAGLLFDAGPTQSPVLLQIGPGKTKSAHAKDPISLHDVFFRVGGAGVGSTRNNLEINSNDTIVDHTWIWRADHGAGVGSDHQPQRKRPHCQRRQRHHLRPVRRASPAVPGPLERQRRPHLLLPIRDPLRSTRPAQLHQCSRHQRLGLLQSSRHRHQPRSLGPRNLQRLPPSQCRPDTRHRSPGQPQRSFSRYDHRRPR